ncbi:hypothetical protein DL96DRAFT_1685035 [Flagelloscypha sp. PMI_526]|nr:hypothetical protein DL96DRAFT_1685035 [Flagelloscypha sp. PMI_526]
MEGGDKMLAYPDVLKKLVRGNPAKDCRMSLLPVHHLPSTLYACLAGITYWSSDPHLCLRWRKVTQPQAQINQPSKTAGILSQLWRDWIKFISWLLGITLAFTVYNIGACALGRFLLDHFHLWDRNIPPDASELNKHAELIAALLASWLSTLAAIGVIIILNGHCFQLPGQCFILDFITLTLFLCWEYMGSGILLYYHYQSLWGVLADGVHMFTTKPLPRSILTMGFGGIKPYSRLKPPIHMSCRIMFIKVFNFEWDIWKWNEFKLGLISPMIAAVHQSTSDRLSSLALGDNFDNCTTREHHDRLLQ